ncbi:phospholipid-transporting ATPase IC-like [Lissotriton helveticus]
MDTVHGNGNKKKRPDQTWEVRANDRIYHALKKKKSFLCFSRLKYAGNSIKSSKYNVLTFIPLNLLEQYHQVHIIYFTFIIILQTIPDISPYSWLSGFILVCILLASRALRDMLEDIARHKSDKMVNNRPCDILRGSSFCQQKWKHIKVGDIVRLKKDDLVPADLLLLHSSEPNSLCYVETSGIDGETNLKFRQALMVTHAELSSIQALAAFDGRVFCESPNSKIHTFVGNLEWKGEKHPLDQEKMLLRGCSIRNTATCYGLVIYAGFDTKIMRNSGKVKMKRTRLDSLMNRITVSVFIIIIICAFVFAVMSGLWHERIQKKHSYVPAMSPKFTAAFYSFKLFWSHFINMCFLVPIMLFITVQAVLTAHSLFINWDLEMYCAKTDTPAAARATSLNDNLGRIEYVFSDKTGTLTQNIMTFRKCCINGRVYGTSPDGKEKLKEVNFCWNPYADRKFRFHDQTLVDMARDNKKREVVEFFRLLALCHTVMVDEKEGNLVYQAASPDEEALVTAARNFGYVFVARTQDTITVKELGVERIYNVLALMDFNSDRKRMSVLVRDPDGKIMLYTKGADDVIFKRLYPGSKNDASEKALDTFASETLRTLCVACKHVEESEYIMWSEKHTEACVTLENRAKKLHATYEEIETDLELLGVTAIEDKLQDGVPETINLLLKGDIKVWMLTGDKQETAVNIGFASQLLSDDMEILDEYKICEMMDATLKNTSSNGNVVLRSDTTSDFRRTALVVTGELLSSIRSPDTKKTTKKGALLEKLEALCCPKKREKNNVETQRERAFVDLACRCHAVICCRVTPEQKAIVVDLVKKHNKAITLAIGDGGNDVNMIKTAHIGVGISGQEGLQAVIASDYALAQFRFLQRLLFVHGRWSSYRMCKFLSYYFYKTFSYQLIALWFSIFNAFSAQTVFDIWFLLLHPLLYTSFPALCMGMLDQDVGAKTSLQFPELYRTGQIYPLFNLWIFLRSIVYGTYTSLVSFFVALGAFWDTAGPEGICDLKAFGVTIGTVVVIAAIIEISMNISYWNAFSAVAVIASLVFYFLFSYLVQLPTSSPNKLTFEGVNININAFAKPYIWLVILLATVICVLPSLFARSVSTIVTRRKEDQPQKEVAMDDNTVKLESYFKRNDWLRSSSSAFSHKEGYADLITQGISLRNRRQKPSNKENKATNQEEMISQI